MEKARGQQSDESFKIYQENHRNKRPWRPVRYRSVPVRLILQHYNINLRLSDHHGQPSFIRPPVADVIFLSEGACASFLTLSKSQPSSRALKAPQRYGQASHTVVLTTLSNRGRRKEERGGGGRGGRRTLYLVRERKDPGYRRLSTIYYPTSQGSQYTALFMASDGG